MYLKNDVTGQIGIFNVPQIGWSAPTQAEIDAYLLANAKAVKINELDSDKSTFCDAGVLYSGNTFGISDESTQNMILKNNILGYESNNVSVLAATKSYNLPEGHKVGVVPGQTIYVSGFTDSANNGAKTVDHLENNFLLVTDILVDEAAGDSIIIANGERYKYYNINDVQIDFANNAGWNNFYASMINEKDRVMRYYCSKKKDINDAPDMETLDAIIINFSA